jgi:hypothetical protein
VKTRGEDIIIEPALDWRDLGIFKTVAKGQVEMQRKMQTDPSITMTAAELAFAERIQTTLVELIYLQPEDDQEFVISQAESAHLARAIRANNYAELTKEGGHLVDPDSIMAEAALPRFEEPTRAGTRPW